MNTRFRTLAVVLILLLAALPVWAIEFRSGTTTSVPAGTTLPDDLYAAGQIVDIAGTVDGDIFGAGQTVTLSGSTTHDAMLAGSMVNLTGTAGDDLRAAGGTVNISGAVTDSASLAGGTVTLAGNGRIGRNLGATGGTVLINGAVARNVSVTGGQVTINGRVGGDVVANASKLNIGSGAVIRGNLVYTSSQRATIAPGAKILGTTTYHQMVKKERRRAPGALFGLWLISLIGAFIVGSLILALSPVASVAAADTARSRPWISILVGFIILVAVPIALVIIAITIIGLPLALILLAAYLIMLYIANILAGFAIGRWIFDRARRPNVSLFLALLVGLVVLWILTAIPVLGGLIGFIALLIGLGALATQRYTMMRTFRQEGRI